MNPTTMEHLSSLHGDALERAYALLRDKVIAQRAAARVSRTEGAYLMLLAERTRAGGIVPIRAIVSDKPVHKMPTDTVLVHQHLSERPNDVALRAIVDTVFRKLNNRAATFTNDTVNNTLVAA